MRPGNDGKAERYFKIEIIKIKIRWHIPNTNFQSSAGTNVERRDKRRTHDKLTLPALSTCSNCGATVLYHRVCPECGYYRGRLMVEKNVE